MREFRTKEDHEVADMYSKTGTGIGVAGGVALLALAAAGGPLIGLVAAVSVGAGMGGLFGCGAGTIAHVYMHSDFYEKEDPVFWD